MDCLRSFILAKAMFLVLCMLVLWIVTRSMMILCLSLTRWLVLSGIPTVALMGFEIMEPDKTFSQRLASVWGLDWKEGELLHEADIVVGNNMRTSRDSGWSKYRHRLSQLGQHWSQTGYDYLQFC
jgi:hypothetical protein